MSGGPTRQIPPAWLRGAAGAPSAHNTQPWRFTPLPDGRIGVGWAPKRTLPIGDPTGRDLFLSLGAAVESARLHALAEGVAYRFEPARPDAQHVVGWLVTEPDVGPPDANDQALAAVLDRRQTARGSHLPRAVPSRVTEALIAEAARHDRRLVVAQDRPTIRRLAALAGQATAALFADDAVHAELWQWLRLDPADPAYRRDGLTADCLELHGPVRWLAQQTMPPARMRWLSRLGLNRLFASDTARVARRSAAICLLTTPTWDRDALVATGRVLQRLWLLAATTGLTTHPLSALLDRPETAGPSAATFGLWTPPAPCPSTSEREGLGMGSAHEGHPAAVFRLGFSPPAARSPRLPLDELLVTR